MMPSRMDAAPDRCLTLNRGPHRIRVAPAAGGRILSWTTELPGASREWLVPIEATSWPAHEWPKGGLFPLAPFSNRIRDARLRWDGGILNVDPLPGHPHALHGQAQRMAWDVIQAGPDRAVLEANHPAGDDGWPWAWSLRQIIRLSADGLDIELALSNRDIRPMPAGLGLHPYFTACGTRLVAPTEWAHEQELALHPRPNHKTGWRRTDATWTRFLSDWTGIAAVDWPSGSGLTLQARGPLTHLVLHCNAGRYLCVEPATHVCDAVNLAAVGMPGTGLLTLEPGGTLTVGLAMTIDPRCRDAGSPDA